MKGTYIADIPYPKAKELIYSDTIVMLPIGGGSKEHGDHLPMGTDLHVTNKVAELIVEKFPVLCLPTLPYSYFPAFVDFEGSVNVQATHVINFVKDILLSFVRFGVKKFLILDGGVSTQIPMKLLCTAMNNEYGVKVALTNVLGLGKEVENEVCEQQRGGHGDESETSCMLYINDKLVDMRKAVEEYMPILPGTVVNGIDKVYFPSKMTTPTGINGDSTLATYEKGEKIIQAMANDVVAFLEFFKDYKVD